MSNGWGKVDTAKEGSGLFLKLESGKSVQCMVVGEPYGFYQIYPEKKEYADWVPGSSFRFKINVAVLENGAFTMKIFNQGVTVAKTLRKFLQKLGPNTLFEIEREGSGKDDTVYHIIPMGPVSPEQLEQVKKLKSHNLMGKEQGDTSFDTAAMDAERDAEQGNY